MCGQLYRGFGKTRSFIVSAMGIDCNGGSKGHDLTGFFWKNILTALLRIVHRDAMRVVGGGNEREQRNRYCHTLVKVVSAWANGGISERDKK